MLQKLHISRFTKSSYLSCEKPTKWYNLTKKFCVSSLAAQLVHDSGSPMVCQDKNDKNTNNAVLIGIQSLEHQTNLSYFSSWIIKTVVSFVT